MFCVCFSLSPLSVQTGRDWPNFSDHCSVYPDLLCDHTCFSSSHQLLQHLTSASQSLLVRRCSVFCCKLKLNKEEEALQSGQVTMSTMIQIYCWEKPSEVLLQKTGPVDNSDLTHSYFILCSSLQFKETSSPESPAQSQRSLVLTEPPKIQENFFHSTLFDYGTDDCYYWGCSAFRVTAWSLNDWQWIEKHSQLNWNMKGKQFVFFVFLAQCDIWLDVKAEEEVKTVFTNLIEID